MKRILKRLYGSPPQLSAELARARTEAPKIVLLGKVQAGKSSIVQAIVGDSSIEIGEGFRACTKSLQEYPYPSSEEPLVTFLDGRGVLETGYDHTTDLQRAAKEAHAVLIVVRAADESIAPLYEMANRLRRQHPDWPCLLVQTSLHECYTNVLEHELPYPEPSGLPTRVEHRRLRERLEQQRLQFAPITSNAIAVDFTKAEDGFVPTEYGREQLLTKLDELLPRATWNLLANLHRGAISRIHLRRAQPHILFYTTLAASAALNPIPLVDIPVIAAIHAKMFHALGGVYRQEFSKKQILELLGMLGLGSIGPLSWRALSKFVPGGSLVYGAYSGAYTYALGIAACSYFEQIKRGTTPSAEELRTLFKHEFDTAKSRFFSERR